MSVRSQDWAPRRGPHRFRAGHLPGLLAVAALIVSVGAGLFVLRPAAGAQVRLGLYFDELTRPANLTVDAGEIPMVAYDGILQYNPVTIAQQALAHFDQWLDRHDANERRLFLRLSDWLVSNQKPDGIFEYTFAFGGQPIPWWSALAQGQALSLFARAYQESGDVRYLDALRRSLATFTRPAADRGVKLVDGGYVWFEEYMAPYAPHTLNGFIWALGGLRDTWLAFADPLAKQLWDEGLRTLVHDLPRFDAAGWSCYSLRWPDLAGCNPATKYYQHLHVSLLRTFFNWTGEPVFRTYADRWEAGEASPPPYARADSLPNGTVYAPGGENANDESDRRRG